MKAEAVTGWGMVEGTPEHSAANLIKTQLLREQRTQAVIRFQDNRLTVSERDGSHPIPLPAFSHPQTDPTIVSAFVGNPGEVFAACCRWCGIVGRRSHGDSYLQSSSRTVIHGDLPDACTLNVSIRYDVSWVRFQLGVFAARLRARWTRR
jgi:hypothetical protein